jgi:hypothetical protein
MTVFQFKFHTLVPYTRESRYEVEVKLTLAPQSALTCADVSSQQTFCQFQTLF